MSTFPPVNRAGFILAAHNVQTLSAFYENVLGFEVTASYEDPPYIILKKAGMRLSLTLDGNTSEDLSEFTYRTNQSPEERAAVMVLEVDDCDGAFEYVQSQNLKIRSTIFRPPWGGARFFFSDPEGNLIEVEELV